MIWIGEQPKRDFSIMKKMNLNGKNHVDKFNSWFNNIDF